MTRKELRVAIKKEAKKRTKENLGQSILVLLFLVLVSSVVSFSAVLSSFNPFVIAIVSSLSSAASFFLLVPIEIGYANFFVKQYRGEKPTFKDIFSGFSCGHYARNLLTILLATVPILIASFIFGIALSFGLILLQFNKVAAIIILSIFGALLYAFIIIYAYSIYLLSYSLCESDKSAWGAFKEAFEMTNGHKWELFVCDLSFIPWILFVMITFGIGIIFVGPYITTTMAGYYVALK